MRLLIVSYHFHPSNAIGAVRWTGFAQALESLGSEVRVVAADAQVENPPARVHPHLETIPPNGQEANPLRMLPDRFFSLLRQSNRSMLGEDEFPDSTVAPAGKSRLRREISAATAAPDVERRWSLKAHASARRVCRDWAPDLILSSGPPHSVHVAASALARERSVPWVADLRDPLFYVPDPATWVGRFTNSFLEQLITREAALILTTSPTLTREFEGRLGSEKVRTIPNGVILDDLLAVSPVAWPGFSICHLGSILADRNPVPVLKALLRLRQSCRDNTYEHSTFRLVGSISSECRSLVGAVAHDMGMPDAVELIDPLPRAEALRLLRGSDLAIVLAQNQHHSIPGKLYESVAAGVPTLVLTECGSATWEMAQSVGAHAVEPWDDEGIERLVARAAQGSLSACPPATARDLDYAAKARELRSLLEGLVA